MYLQNPKCPYPLLGWDLLNKLQATLAFSGDSPRLQLNVSTKALTITYPIIEKYLLLQNPTHSLEEEQKKLLMQEIPIVLGRGQSSWLDKTCATHHNTTEIWGSVYLSQSIWWLVRLVWTYILLWALTNPCSKETRPYEIVAEKNCKDEQLMSNQTDWLNSEVVTT